MLDKQSTIIRRLRDDLEREKEKAASRKPCIDWASREELEERLDTKRAELAQRQKQPDETKEPLRTLEHRLDTMRTELAQRQQQLRDTQHEMQQDRSKALSLEKQLATTRMIALVIAVGGLVAGVTVGRRTASVN